MFRNRTRHTLSAALAVCAGLGIALTVPHYAQNTVCQYQPKFAFNPALPASHVSNQCSQDEVSQVSWLSWVAGDSQSYQFHFLDLLELLSRNSDDQDMTQQPGQ